MKTQTQVLIKKAVHIPECRDGLENLNATIDRATHLIDQLLSLARIQNENILLDTMNLSDCLRDVLDECLPLAVAKSQTIHINVTDNILVNGCTDSLSILIRNLVDNAIKYTPDHGSITISLSEDGRLSISDSGPGLSDADKIRVFGRFMRADKSGQTGSGLGLSITQSIAEQHHLLIHLADNKPQGLSVQISFNVNTPQ
jgi:signal transduction histidine kinase